MIKQLRESSLYAECPNCQNEFSLSKVELFDGTRKFPKSAELIKSELLFNLKERQSELSQRLKDLEKRKIRAHTGSEKKAIKVGMGKIMEKVVFKGINRLDMYLWRKTGKDSVVSNFMWKIQSKYMSRSKKQRKLLTIALMGLIGTYYGWMIIT